MKRLAIVGSLGLVVALAFFSARHLPVFQTALADDEPAASLPKARALPVDAIRVELSNGYERLRSYTGLIAARRTSEVGFELGGKLLAIHVDEGDFVSEDQTIAELDTRELRVELERAKAQVKSALATLQMLQRGPRQETIAAAQAEVRGQESTMRRAERDLARQQRLAPDGAVSASVVDRSRFGADASAAQVDAARARLGELLAGTREEEIAAQEGLVDQLTAAYHAIRVKLDNSQLKAPFSATVSRRFVDEGSVVNMGAPVFRLVEDQKLEARIGVPVDLTSQLKVGSQRPISCGGESYTGELRCVLPEINRETQTRLAIFDLIRTDSPRDGSDSTVQRAGPAVGQIARLELSRSVSGKGFWLPVTAIQRGQRGLWSAYVAEDRDGQTRVARRDVEILYSDEDRVFVRGTIAAGERVVANGLHRLAPNQLVNVTQEVRVASESEMKAN